MASDEEVYGTIEPYEPSYRQQAEDYIANMLSRSGIISNNYRARTTAESLSNVADFVPFLGDAAGAADSVDAYNRGDYGEAALNAAATTVGLVPGVGDAVAMGMLASVGKMIDSRRVGENIPSAAYDPINAKGYSENPLMANVDPNGPRPENISSGTYKRRLADMDNEVIRAREQARLDGGNVVGTDNLQVRQISYEDMNREGTPLAILPADGTVVGDVNKVGGVDIEPVSSRGGPLHADAYGAWMSGESAARGKQRHANKVRKATGMDPMYVHVNMGNPGSHFSHMPSEIWTNYVDKMGLSDEGWNALDKKMRSLPNKGDTKGVARDWADANIKNTDDVRAFLMPQYGGEKAGASTYGNRRKAFMPATGLKDVQDAGGPILTDVHSSVIEPDLLGQTGMAGYRGMMSVDANPNGMLTDLTRHPSYDTVIEGDGVFTFEEGTVPWNVMFPDLAARRSDKAPAQAYRSAQTNGTEYQLPTDEWLAGIKAYLNQ